MLRISIPSFNRRALILAATFLIAISGGVSAVRSQAAQHAYVPPDGFVPDSSTAAAVAEAVLIPIYGRGNIERERPFRARLAGDAWTVTGTMPRDGVGSVALVQIAKRDGRIIRVTHGR
jgi:hypothetical protein